MKKALVKLGEYIAAIIVVAGAALWLDGKFDDGADYNERVLDSITVLRQETEYLQFGQQFHEEQLMKIEDTMVRLEQKIDMTTRLMNYERRHRDEYSKEQMEEQLKEFEEIIKKNSGIASDTDPIP